MKNVYANLPARHPSLGRWVETQRRLYKKDQLSQERFDLLESIGFKWKF